MNRRRFLLLLSSSTVSLSGCLTTGQPSDAIVKATPLSRLRPTPVSDSGTAPINSRDLPAEEKTIAERAIESEFYHACPDLSDAVRSFADRFNDPDSAYLTHQDSPYALFIRVEDVVYADTAPRPENTPSCGIV